MLTPEQLDQYPEALVRLYALVEQDILADIARRICKTGLLTPTARWQYRKAREMEACREYILQELAVLSKKSAAEIKSIFEESAEGALEFDDRIYAAMGLASLARSDALYDVIEAGMRKTRRLFRNLTGTIANTVTKQFEDALDRAYLQVVSGAFTPQEAARRAVKQLAADGMQSITYPSGHRDHMDVAIRRALLTGLNQTCAEVQIAHAQEMGSDLVQVTSHLGARPTHAVWQGRIFSLSGKHPKYPDFVSSTAYGTGPGLCGWNCRHNFYPFFEGYSADTYERYDTAENNRVYAESQRQRALERRVRQSKRECAAYDASGLTDDFERSAAKLKRQEQELHEFLRQTGRTRRKDREQALGFGRSQSSKAVWVAKRAQSGILKEAGAGIHPITNKAIQAVPMPRSSLLTKAQNKQLQKRCRELLRYMKDDPVGTEGAFTIALDGLAELHRVKGGIGHVKVPPENVPHIMIHNHPSGLMFSLEDVDGFLLNPNLTAMFAVGNNGKLYLLEKSDMLDISGFSNQMRVQKKRYPNAPVKLMESLLKEAKNYGIRYRNNG